VRIRDITHKPWFLQRVRIAGNAEQTAVIARPILSVRPFVRLFVRHILVFCADE